MPSKPGTGTHRLAPALLCALLVVSRGAVGAPADRLPAGRLPLIDASLEPLERLSERAGGEGAVALSRVTMEYRFAVLAGEPLMAFRGRYAFGEAALVPVMEPCRGYFEGAGEDGVTVVAGSFVRVRATGRFAEPFRESGLLSRSLFSMAVVPAQRIVIGDRSLETAGMHVRFRPDSLVAVPADHGPMVSGSPDWGALLRRADGSFVDAATARRVFEVGFDVENLALLEPDYDLGPLAREVAAVCREGVAREREAKAEQAARAGEAPSRSPPPIDAAALENALDSAFGDGAPPRTDPPSPAEDGLAGVEAALASAEENRATRLKIEALRRTSQQFLGLVETEAASVLIFANDHGAEDGDEVAILLNDRTLERFTLTQAGRRIVLPLDVGDNVIEVRALNQGSSGKNTAFFRVTTEAGEALAEKQWELTTGGDAKLLVIRNRAA